MSRLPVSKPFSFSTKPEPRSNHPIISPHRVSKAHTTSRTFEAVKSPSTREAWKALRTSTALASLRASNVRTSSSASETPKSPSTWNAKDAPSNRPFRFLDLPAEIRNNIYTHAAPSAYLRDTTKGRLASRSALPRVNHQIREEFIANLYLTANIIANVDEFNFAHIVTFFNRLSAAEEKSLIKSSTENAQARRQMTILLNVWADMPNSLRRWINRMESLVKKGVGVDISYIVDPKESRDLPGTARHLTRWLRRLRSEKRVAELRKIINAIEVSTPVPFDWPESTQVKERKKGKGMSGV